MTARAAVILAAGQGTRMKSATPKVLHRIGGRTLLARALDVCLAVTSDVRIAGSEKKFAPYAPVVEDLFPGCGPLAGIHAALRASPTDLNVVLAVDVPFVSPALLHFLLAEARDCSALVTVPRAGERFQPLCAVYRRSFAEAAEAALRAGRYKIDALFNQTLTAPVDEEDLLRAGFSADVFRNLNTPEELAEARKS